MTGFSPISLGGDPLARPARSTSSLRRLGLRARGTTLTTVLTVVALVLGACGGATSPSPTPTTAAVRATLPPATAAPPAAPATAVPATAVPTVAPTPAAVVNLEAGEADSGFYLKADRRIVAGGEVTFNITNKGKLTHEVMVYPVQDVTKILAESRAGKHTHADDLIKDIVAAKDDIEPGKSAKVTAKLAPGLYEIACHIAGKDANGSTFTHFDKGQTITLAVTGPGGPATTIGTAASTLNLEMKGDEKASWLFVPDRLVLTKGEISFKATNSMKAEHDVVIHPLADTTGVVREIIEHGGGHFDEWDMVKGMPLFHDLEPGKSATKTLSLNPGLYMAACYMLSKAADGTSFIHRDRGQRVVFEVR